MKKIIISIFFLIINISLFAYINIYPLKFQKDITNGAYEEFTLYNRSSKTRKYRIYLEDNNCKNSMIDWVEIYPKSITLKSLEEKNIKIYIKAPEQIKNGLYETTLVIKEVSLPNSSMEKEKKKPNILTMVKLKLKGKVER